MLAEHRNVRGKVAIKIIKKAPIAKMVAKSGEPYQEIQILKEATANELPNIMRLIDSQEYEHYYILVTQYKSGNSLADYLQRQGGHVLCEERAKSIVRDIA